MTYVKLKVKVEYECDPTVRQVRLKIIVKVKNGGKTYMNEETLKMQMILYFNGDIEDKFADY
jgi:hypothetical protein